VRVRRRGQCGASVPLPAGGRLEGEGGGGGELGPGVGRGF